MLRPKGVWGMKLSVSAFRAHASAHKKILNSTYQSTLNYGATCSTSHQGAGNRYSKISKGDAGMIRPRRSSGSGNGGGPSGTGSSADTHAVPIATENHPTRKAARAASPPNRTRSNQRWMKLRTTVQLSGAIQKNKAQLKREDSFLKRFSTRQIPEPQGTLDTGDDEEGDSEITSNGTITGEKKSRKKKKRRKRPPATVINPDGRFFYYWLLLITVCVLYNFWILIARHSFPELQDRHNRFWMTCDIFTDIVFILDIVVQFRTGYLEQGLMVYDTKKLAGHYMESNSFLLDLITVFPLDLLQLNLGIKPLLRFPRFFKVHRVYHYYYIVEARTVYPNVLRVVNLIHILLILAHWFGCFYYLLSEAEGFQGDWVYPYRPGEYATLSRKYLASLYWSTLTLTTIGDLPTPETNADKGAANHYRITSRGHKTRLLQFHSSWGYIFTIVGYLIGVFIFATIVGQVGNVITNRNANRLEFERLLDGAKSYMRHHKVPGGMKRRVLRWYDYSWSRIQGGGDIHSALGLLPDKLKTELALHVNLSVLKKVTIFQECQPEFLHDLVLKMRAFIFTPGDLICRKGEVAREMFIIADGVLEVISESGRVLTKMRAGDFFGEIGILNLDGLNKRTADVRSVGYSELFSLSREDVLTAMKDYPEAQEILQDLGRRRLREAQNMNRAWKNSVRRRDRRTSATIPRPELPPPPNRSIIEKIKADMKGLKEVFRLGRATSFIFRRKQEDVELQPLTKPKEPPAPLKAKLRRMPRVNDEASYEEAKPPSTPIGAGLPLLQRLKLLKEKQEQEALQANQESATSDKTENQESGSTSITLLQRTFILKQKDEDKDPKELIAVSSLPTVSKGFVSTVRTQFQLPSQRMIKLMIKDPVTFTNSSTPKETTSPISDKQESQSVPEKSNEPSLTGSTESEHFPKHDESWMMIKKAVTRPYPREDSSQGKEFVYESSEAKSLQSAQDNNAQKFDSEATRVKDRVKLYRSIEDLSPEYGELPFVKKLEILNERQKLEETQSHDDKANSDLSHLSDSFSSASSEPIPQTVIEEVESPLNELVHTELNLQAEKETQKGEICLSQQLSSPESNETVERRNLKSILKKLSSGSMAPGALGSSEETDNSVSQPSSLTDMKKLMRAQTIEGYAARHSKLTKNVTFNRMAMNSSSTSGSLTPTSNGVFLPSEVQDANNRNDTNSRGTRHISGESIVSVKGGKNPTCGEPSTSAGTSAHSAEFSRPTLVIEHTRNQNYSNIDPQNKQTALPYIGDLFGQIREIVEGHLDAIECKYVDFFHNLEIEVRKRDKTISHLQGRIQELEVVLDVRGSGYKTKQRYQPRTCVFTNLQDDGRGNSDTSFDGDHPFLRAGSADTILPVSDNLNEDTDQDDSDLHSRLSTDNCSIEDHSDGSVEALDGMPRKDYVSVDVDSSETSFESESEDIDDDNEYDVSNIVDDDDDIDEELRNKYHYNWEVQMLAEELEKKKSSSKRAMSFDSPQGTNIISLRRSSFDQNIHKTRKPLELFSTGSLEIHRRLSTSSLPRRRCMSITNMQRKMSTNGIKNTGNIVYQSSGEEPRICDLSLIPTSKIVSKASAFDECAYPVRTVPISSTSVNAGSSMSRLNAFTRRKILLPSSICLKENPQTGGSFSSTPDVTCSDVHVTGGRARIHSCPVSSSAKPGDSPVLGLEADTPTNDSENGQRVSPTERSSQSPGVFPSSADTLSPVTGNQGLPPSTSKK
ncbi:uncharacterized protein LOC106668912 isoform X2 [Cimex lectularius]|uniref:Cyclic nucleotide-binding domain-containing protein n=1 Tax=Cimex lectularius TaxID=79782 RepID=A0A8I6RW90_CIMLE|nr:uncharacterized protein LOC106668912 isoform X2 [Cimex lectularius]